MFSNAFQCTELSANNGLPLIYPNILDCLWCILIYWIVCDVSQFIGCTTTNKPIILRAGLLYMTQFIGWTTTHKPLNLKDWPLYMTQYIWSYSFAAQSKLMPHKFLSPHQEPGAKLPSLHLRTQIHVCYITYESSVVMNIIL